MLSALPQPNAKLEVVGEGNSSSTWTAQFHNSAGNNNALMIRDDGNVGIGTNSPGARLDARASTGVIAFFGEPGGGTRLEVNSSGRVGLGLIGWIPTTNGGQSITTGAGGCFIGYDATGDLSYPHPSVTLGRPLNRLLNATTGTQEMVDIVGNFSPTTGNGNFYNLGIIATINQTGGSNGITRGLYIQPTLTSAADWRSIQWDNSSGWGIYGAGTAKSYFAGNVAIGTTAQNASAAFEVASTTQGVLFPRMTITERNAIATPADGLVIYNTTDNKLQVRAGGAWVDLH